MNIFADRVLRNMIHISWFSSPYLRVLRFSVAWLPCRDATARIGDNYVTRFPLDMNNISLPAE